MICITCHNISQAYEPIGLYCVEIKDAAQVIITKPYSVSQNPKNYVFNVFVCFGRACGAPEIVILLFFIENPKIVLWSLTEIN